MVELVLHASLTGSQLHNPKGLQYSEDLLFFDSSLWHNSGLMWNKDISGGKWIPKPSGAGGAAGTPGGSDTQVQFNDSDSFGGDSALTWNKTTNTLTIDGAISSQNISGGSIKGTWIGDAITSSYISDYIASSVAIAKFYDSEADLIGLLNDNYPGSSNVNRALINSISSNLDIRIDSIFGYSSNAKNLYADSGNVRYRFVQSGGTKWIDLTDGEETTLHTHSGIGGAPAGSFTANIGSDYTYGISGVKFVSSQSISGGTIFADTITANTFSGITGASGQRYAYSYGVYLDGATYKTQRGSDGDTVSHSNAAHAIQYGIDNAVGGTVKLLTDITLTATISGADDVTFDLNEHKITVDSAFKVIKMHQGFDVRNGEITAYAIDFTDGIMIGFNASVAEGSYTPGYSHTRVSDLALWSNNQKGTAIKLNNTTGGRGLSNVRIDNIATYKFDKSLHLYVSSNTTPCYINMNEFNDIHGAADNYFIFLERYPHENSTEIAGNIFSNYRLQATANTRHVVYASSNQSIWWNKFHGITFDWAASDYQYAYEFKTGCLHNMIEDIMIGSVGAGTPRFKYVSSPETNYTRMTDISYNRNALRNIYTKYLHSEYQGGDLNIMLDSGATNTDEIVIQTRNAVNNAELARLTFTNQATTSYAHFANCNVGINDTSPDYALDVNGTTQSTTLRSTYISTNHLSSNSLYGYTISCHTWKGPTVGGGGLSNIVEDTTPQLGGNLDGQSTYGAYDLVSVSSQSISGAWHTPIYRGTGKPTASATYEGRIIRTSGAASQKTYVWICVINDAGSYEWVQLAVSS